MSGVEAYMYAQAANPQPQVTERIFGGQTRRYSHGRLIRICFAGNFSSLAGFLVAPCCSQGASLSLCHVIWLSVHGRTPLPPLPGNVISWQLGHF